MKITGSFRASTMIAVSAIAAAMLVTVFGVRSLVDPNGTTARADATSPAAISVYDLQMGAPHGLPAQQFDAI
jgi:hypothetical protein